MRTEINEIGQKNNRENNKTKSWLVEKNKSENSLGILIMTIRMITQIMNSKNAMRNINNRSYRH